MLCSLTNDANDSLWSHTALNTAQYITLHHSTQHNTTSYHITPHKTDNMLNVYQSQLPVLFYLQLLSEPNIEMIKLFSILFFCFWWEWEHLYVLTSAHTNTFRKRKIQRVYHCRLPDIIAVQPFIHCLCWHSMNFVLAVRWYIYNNTMCYQLTILNSGGYNFVYIVHHRLN